MLTAMKEGVLGKWVDEGNEHYKARQKIATLREAIDTVLKSVHGTEDWDMHDLLLNALEATKEEG